jgi:hypothetical protein
MVRSVVTAVLLVAIGGCQTPLDVRQTELIRTWGEGNRAFGKVIEEYCTAMDNVAGRHHQTQRELRDKDWELWLSGHTQEDGGLVYRDDDGTVKPMTVTRLQAAITLRDQASQTIADSERVWQEADARIKKAVEDFKIMTATAMNTNEDIAEAKKSTQQFMESALSALTGLAGGFGLGAAVAP